MWYLAGWMGPKEQVGESCAPIPEAGRARGQAAGRPPEDRLGSGLGPAELPLVHSRASLVSGAGRLWVRLCTREVTHLVKEAVLADELFPGLGVDGNGEPHVCHQQLDRKGRPELGQGLRPENPPSPGALSWHREAGVHRLAEVWRQAPLPSSRIR